MHGQFLVDKIVDLTSVICSTHRSPCGQTFFLVSHHVHERVAVIGHHVVLDGLLDAQALSASFNDLFGGVDLQKARLPVKCSLKQKL